MAKTESKLGAGTYVTQSNVMQDGGTYVGPGEELELDDPKEIKRLVQAGAIIPKDMHDKRRKFEEETAKRRAELDAEEAKTRAEFEAQVAADQEKLGLAGGLPGSREPDASKRDPGTVTNPATKEGASDPANAGAPVSGDVDRSRRGR